MNIVCISGRNVTDAEIKVLPSGDKIAKIRLAVYQGKDSTGFFDCIAFGKTAEMCQTIKKGEQVAIEGKLRQREYNRKDGSKASCFEISVVSVSYLHSTPYPKLTPEDMAEINSLDFTEQPKQVETPKNDAINLDDLDLPF